ncbi:MAG: hypothetical protein ACTSU9_14115 [Promethearchaeota archaeon]
MMVPEEHEDYVQAVVFSELGPDGTDARAWITNRPLTNRELTQIGLKSISLMTSEDRQGSVQLDGSRTDPKEIINQEGTFGIIPFADQESIGICYLLIYNDVKGDVRYSTISVLFHEEHKSFLFENHDDMKKLIKFVAFEILKKIINEELPIPFIQQQLELLLEKINRLRDQKVPEDSTYN